MNIEDLTKLYNTLVLIETKGASTKLMGDCLKFIEESIKEEKAKEAQNTAEV